MATGTAAELGGAGIEVSVPPGSTTTFQATATDANGDTLGLLDAAHLHRTQSGSGHGGGGRGLDRAAGRAPTKVSVGPSTPGRAALTSPRTRGSPSRPASKTRQRNPVFRFTDSTGQPGTRFHCKIDRQRLAAAAARRCKLKRLARGRHVFAVKGGQRRSAMASRQPAKRAFKVVPG